MKTEPKGNKEFSTMLEIVGVSPQDAGSYKVTAKNDLGESNATIGLNFDGRLLVPPFTFQSVTKFLHAIRSHLFKALLA